MGAARLLRAHRHVHGVVGHRRYDLAKPEASDVSLTSFWPHTILFLPFSEAAVFHGSISILATYVALVALGNGSTTAILIFAFQLLYLLIGTFYIFFKPLELAAKQIL